MGSTWGRQDPDGPYVGPMNLAIWDILGIYVKHHIQHDHHINKAIVDAYQHNSWEENQLWIQQIMAKS